MKPLKKNGKRIHFFCQQKVVFLAFFLHNTDADSTGTFRFFLSHYFLLFKSDAIRHNTNNLNYLNKKLNLFCRFSASLYLCI